MTADGSVSGVAPPVALTMGEPAGIGPEIAAKAFASLQGSVPFFVIGDPRHLPKGVPFTRIDAPDKAHGATSLPVLLHDFDTPRVPGVAQAEHAQPVIDAIARAVDLTRRGQALAVCTNPINTMALLKGWM